MNLSRTYRVLVESPFGDTHLIVTDSRTRALKFWTLLSTQPGWTEPRIALGNQTYTEKTMEQLP